MKVLVPIQSYTDIITNSSSEIFSIRDNIISSNLPLIVPYQISTIRSMVETFLGYTPNHLIKFETVKEYILSEFDEYDEVIYQDYTKEEWLDDNFSIKLGGKYINYSEIKKIYKLKTEEEFIDLYINYRSSELGLNKDDVIIHIRDEFEEADKLIKFVKTELKGEKL